MKTCDGCILQNEDDNEICDDCSRNDVDIECTCHISPPCSFCVNDKYEKKSEIKPKLNLSNIDGNAFVIMGAASKALKNAGYSDDLIKKYKKEATSGDYDHLIQTTMDYCEVE